MLIYDPFSYENPVIYSSKLVFSVIHVRSYNGSEVYWTVLRRL